MDVKEIQQALKEQGFDGWLFYDFHNRDVIAYRILGLDPSGICTRRWYYYIPAVGEPKKLVHSIERGRLDALPGEKFIYLPWPQQHQLLKAILKGAKRVAMQYSPMNAIPYISLVDAGTVELVRSFGVEVVSSADLVQRFEARLSEDAYQSHVEAGRRIHKILDLSFEEIGRRVKNGHKPTEYQMQQFILENFRRQGIVWEDSPIVAINEHTADPHYEPQEVGSARMGEGDFVLIDLWGKLERPEAVHFDITWTGYIGNQVPTKYVQIFEIVKGARDRAVEFLQERFAAGEDVYGWEVDDVARNSIKKHGYGQYFIHRTGHSIGEEVHGNGVNIDNLETRDERKIAPRSCFSIEPGIYLEHQSFGVRSEVDVFVTDEGKVEVTGPRQEEVIAILK